MPCGCTSLFFSQNRKGLHIKLLDNANPHASTTVKEVWDLVKYAKDSIENRRALTPHPKWFRTALDTFDDRSIIVDKIDIVVASDTKGSNGETTENFQSPNEDWQSVVKFPLK